jgi:Tol biopolymer transport system component
VNFSSSADGKRLCMLRASFQSHIFVAQFKSADAALENLRPLNMDQQADMPFAWTPDSKAVIFVSDRNGQAGIFKQGLDKEAPETLAIAGEVGARVSSDGSWLLYGVGTRETGPAALAKLMRMRLSGGPTENQNFLLVMSLHYPHHFFLVAVVGVQKAALTNNVIRSALFRSESMSYHGSIPKVDGFNLA